MIIMEGGKMTEIQRCVSGAERRGDAPGEHSAHVPALFHDNGRRNVESYVIRSFAIYTST